MTHATRRSPFSASVIFTAYAYMAYAGHAYAAYNPRILSIARITLAMILNQVIRVTLITRTTCSTVYYSAVRSLSIIIPRISFNIKMGPLESAKKVAAYKAVDEYVKVIQCILQIFSFANSCFVVEVMASNRCALRSMNFFVFFFVTFRTIALSESVAVLPWFTPCIGWV